MPKCILDSVRVLVGDKTPMNGQLVAEALAKDNRIRICGSASRSSEILRIMQTAKPDVVLLSSQLADGERKGFEVARGLHTSHPDVLCVMLLDSADSASVIEAFRCGVRGVFSRSESIKLLIKCVHCVRSGQIWASSAELLFLLEVLREGASFSRRTVPTENLSKREYQVVEAVSEGLTNREIAGKLGLTEHTVKGYLYRIFEKLGVSTRVELAVHTFSAVSARDAKRTGTMYRRENAKLPLAVGEVESRF